MNQHDNQETLDPNNKTQEDAFDNELRNEAINLKLDHSDKAMRRIAPFIIIIAGIVIGVLIIKSKKRPEQKERINKGILVDTLKAKSEDRQIVVKSHGNVQPKHQLTIIPEVAGRITYVNPNLVVGGLIKKNAVMIRIDPLDYKIAASKAEAQIAQVERSLAEAKSNADVAQREWKILGKKTGQKPTPLTLGQPQLKQAKALMEAAKADLKMAKVRLSRTAIRAPFDLRIRKEGVEVGQYVTPGMQLATAFGTAKVEVIVPLQVSELQWIKIPKLRFNKNGEAEKDGDGSTAEVSLKIGNKSFKRSALVERKLGEIDPTGRLTRVVVSIDDPYNLKREADATYQPDFEVGSFVQVRIFGTKISNTLPVPAEAVRIGPRLWIVSKDRKLEIRKVKVARMTTKEALIADGLKEGEDIIISPVPNAVEGLKLRLARDEKEKNKDDSVKTKKSTKPKKVAKGS